MKTVRTRLEDRVLPSYTRGEEIFNMISHIVGGAFAIAALVLCVVFGALNSDAWGVVGAAIYGSTMIVLYTMSSIYHGLKPEMPKKVFQVIDHCTIYFLIAGTYTPVTLAALRPLYPVQAFVIFGIVWACCFAAATLTVFLVAGGLAYTVGAILYGVGKKKKYVHSVFHLFVLAGSILHFFMILFYVLM